MKKKTTKREVKATDLRTILAGQAMMGLLAHPKCGFVGEGFEAVTDCVADEAVLVAEALIRRLETEDK